jgi:hypothetical protein
VADDLFNYSGKLIYLTRVCRDDRLTKSAMAVSTVLVNYADKRTGACYPSIDRIVTESGVPRTTAIKSLKRLAQLGHMQAIKKLGASTNYLLTSPEDGTRPGGGTRAIPNATSAISNLRRGKTSPARGTDPVPAPEHEQRKAIEATGIEQTESSAGARFSEFYLAYPRKEGRPKAEKAWRAGKLDRFADKILADVVERVGDEGGWKGTETKFIPLPATYLNGRRWEDEWARKGTRAVLPRDVRSEDDIEAANNEALKRIGGTHG